MQKIALTNTSVGGVCPLTEMFVHDWEADAATTIGNHEMFNVEFLHRELKPDSNFADVGGYEGYFSLVASTIIKTGNIYTFEPVRNSYDIIKANVALHKIPNIQVFNAAVSNRTGTVEIIWREGAQCASHIFERPYDNNEQQRTTVPVFTLDSLLDTTFQGRTIDVMKVDIEGAEVELFRGGKEFFKRNPGCRVMLELHCVYIRPRADVSLNDFMDHLWSDFRIFSASMIPMEAGEFNAIRSTGGANLVVMKK